MALIHAAAERFDPGLHQSRGLDLVGVISTEDVRPRRIADPTAERARRRRSTARSPGSIRGWSDSDPCRAVDDALVDAQAGLRGEGRHPAAAVGVEAALAAELGQLAAHERVDRGQLEARLQEIGERVVDGHDVLGGPLSARDVCL